MEEHSCCVDLVTWRSVEDAERDGSSGSLAPGRESTCVSVGFPLCEAQINSHPMLMEPEKTNAGNSVTDRVAI